MTKLSTNLRRLRRSLGLKQEELGRMLGVDRSTVTNWERGAKQPGLESLLKLSSIFNVTLDELVLGREGKLPVAHERPVSYLAADPLIKSLAERTNVSPKAIAAFIDAMRAGENDPNNS